MTKDCYRFSCLSVERFLPKPQLFRELDRRRDNAGVNDHVVNNSKDRLQAFQGSEWFVGYTDISLRTT